MGDLLRILGESLIPIFFEASYRLTVLDIQKQQKDPTVSDRQPFFSVSLGRQQEELYTRERGSMTGSV